MPSVREKACAYYRDQDLRLLTVDCHEGSIQPYVVEALVRGYKAMHRVTLLNGVWSCTCDDAAGPDCAHRAAIQMVTGHRSSAAKEPAKELVAGAVR